MSLVWQVGEMVLVDIRVEEEEGRRGPPVFLVVENKEGFVQEELLGLLQVAVDFILLKDVKPLEHVPVDVVLEVLVGLGLVLSSWILLFLSIKQTGLNIANLKNS